MKEPDYEPMVAAISRLATNYGRLMGLATGFKWELERNPDAEDRERRMQAIQEIIDECAKDQIKETAALIVGRCNRPVFPSPDLLRVRAMLGLGPDSSDQEVACGVATLFNMIGDTARLREDAKRLDCPICSAKRDNKENIRAAKHRALMDMGDDE